MLLVEARKNSIRIHGNGVFDFVSSTTERQPGRPWREKVHSFTAFLDLAQLSEQISLSRLFLQTILYTEN